MSEEKILGQRFVVDCTLHVDLRAAGASDSLNDTVDYANVYRVIGSVVTGKPKNLIEAVAEEICARIFRMDSRVESVDCTVKKPHVAVGGIVEYLGVSIRRERGERQSSDACSGEDEEGEAKVRLKDACVRVAWVSSGDMGGRT